MIKMKDILTENETNNILNQICMHWSKVPSKTRNEFVTDPTNYLSNGFPIDVQQICDEPAGWNFTGQDMALLKKILDLPSQ